jgi:hypothetical protein
MRSVAKYLSIALVALALLITLLMFILNQSIIVDRIDTVEMTRLQLARADAAICEIKRVCGKMPVRDAESRFAVCNQCESDRYCRAEAANFESLNRDFWGNPIEYKANEATAFIVSFGSDGKPGGEGRDADITHVVSCD